MCSTGVRSPARTRAHRRDWQGAEWSASPCTCPAGLRREERVTMKDPVGNAVLETWCGPHVGLERLFLPLQKGKLETLKTTFGLKIDLLFQILS